MNPVRLEIVQDDPVAAPHLSRVLPALLNNVVAESSYHDFCDTIDSLLSLAAVDYKCHAQRLRWWNFGIAFWTIVFFGFCFATLSPLRESDQFYYTAYIWTIVSIIYMVAIRIWMNCPTGTTPATETMKEIRAECEAMTKRTPHASFHVVLLPLATALRGYHLYANPIGFIEVSVSVVGLELARMKADLPPMEVHNNSGSNSGNASSSPPPPTLHTTSIVTNDYQQLGTV